jgi:hypothetical protein
MLRTKNVGQNDERTEGRTDGDFLYPPPPFRRGIKSTLYTFLLNVDAVFNQIVIPNTVDTKEIGELPVLNKK